MGTISFDLPDRQPLQKVGEVQNEAAEVKLKAERQPRELLAGIRSARTAPGHDNSC